MPDARLARARVAYEPHDPFNRLARFYIQHAKQLLDMGEAQAARDALEQAQRLLGREILDVNDGMVDS